MSIQLIGRWRLPPVAVEETPPMYPSLRQFYRPRAERLPRWLRRLWLWL
jgi:hypothetical protein